MKLLQKQFFTGESDSIRLSTASFQGGRKYMEDEFSIVHYSPSQNEGKENARPSAMKPFLFFGIFDGHGGDMASKYSRDNLCNNIIRQHGFWSDNDQDVCRAIHNGFVATQKQMQEQVAYWPKTTLGHMSTAGTTASVIFIINGKYYTGHVGDSRIILARENKTTKCWESFPLTLDHKPNAPEERTRIEKAGGKVINKSGVSRVVWKRLKYSANPSPLAAPTSADFDVIPFLAVARALGDLWSYNKKRDLFVVSPEPDVNCVPITASDQCLILATDGLWNMITNQTAVNHVKSYEKGDTEDTQYTSWNSSVGELSHSSYLVEHCMKKWSKTKYRADNITVLTVMLDIDRTKMKQPDQQTFSRPKVDDEGNLFCPSMIGKMINYSNDDDPSSESDTDNDVSSCRSASTIITNQKSTFTPIVAPFQKSAFPDLEVQKTIEDLINKVCSQFNEFKSEQESSLIDKSDKNGLKNNDKNNNYKSFFQSDICVQPSDSDETGSKLKLNVPIFTSSQMEDIHFTHVISSDGFQGYQDSFCETIHLDRTIFGADHLPDYPSAQDTPPYGNNHSSIMERSIAIINHNDLSFFHQEELADSGSFVDSVIHSKNGNATVSAQHNCLKFEMRAASADIHCENSENACDFELTLKRKIEGSELPDSDCKASMAKRLCALNLSCDVSKDGN